MPEMQAAMLSNTMLPPSHTWTGFRSLRSDTGEQGRRKPAIPATHYTKADDEVTHFDQIK